MGLNVLKRVEDLRQKFLKMETSASKLEIAGGVDAAISFYADTYIMSSESIHNSGESPIKVAEDTLSHHASKDWANLKPSRWSRSAAQALAYFAFHTELRYKLNNFAWRQRSPDGSGEVLPMPFYERATRYLSDDETDLGYLITPWKLVQSLNRLELNNSLGIRTTIVDYLARLTQRPTKQLTLEELALRAVLTLWLRQDEQESQAKNLSEPEFPITTIPLGGRRENVAFCMHLKHNGFQNGIALHLQRYELHLPAKLSRDGDNGWKHLSEDKIGKTCVLKDGTIEIEWQLEIPDKGQFLESTTDAITDSFTVICPEVKKDPWTTPIKLVRAKEPNWVREEHVRKTTDASDERDFEHQLLRFKTRDDARKGLEQILTEVINCENSKEAPVTFVAITGIPGMGRKLLLDDLCHDWQSKEGFEQRVVVITDANDDTQPVVSAHDMVGHYSWNPESWVPVFNRAKDQLIESTLCFITMAKLDDSSVGDIDNAMISQDFLDSRPIKRVTYELKRITSEEIELALRRMLNDLAGSDAVVLDPRCGRFIEEATDGYPELVVPLIKTIVFNVYRQQNGWYVSRRQIESAINDLCNTDLQNPGDIHGAIKAYVTSRLLRVFPVKTKREQYELARWILWQVDEIQTGDLSQDIFKRGASEEQLELRAHERGKFKNLLNILNRLVEINLLSETDGFYQFRSGFLPAWAKREAN
jgi:hypothetical protein